MIRFQKITQTLSFLIFLTLLYFAAHPFLEGLNVDLLLRFDPIVVVGTAVATREFHLYFLPGLMVLAAGVLLGRIFCGHICPMGTTIDLAQSLMGRATKPRVKDSSFEATARQRSWKYLLLAAIMAAAAAGVSLVHLGSPLSLVTRLYGTVIYPMTLLAGEFGIQRLLPSFADSIFPGLTYLEFPQKVFAANAFVAIVVGGIIGLAYWKPRFWCRNLCPAGALIALFSIRPFWRRTVSDSCTKCGRCIRGCPTGAIGSNPEMTVHSECIVCLRCKEVCPESAISFGHSRNVPAGPPLPSFSRRELLFGFGSGLAGAGLLCTGINQPRLQSRERSLVDADLVRPPGALPEAPFLTRCIRCGECMKACPTNTLQPIWFKAGLEGIFSPVMVPRLGACAVECNVCGKVCPTGAIRDIPLVEKKHAKVGTAWVARQNCLVWDQDKKCLVCDECCPYSAVSFRPVPGLKNAAPFVEANKCVGCGWCETKCPVDGSAAIRVNIQGEIRLSSGSYVEKAEENGYVFKTRDKIHDKLAPETFDSGEDLPADYGSPDAGSKNGSE